VAPTMHSWLPCDAAEAVIVAPCSDGLADTTRTTSTGDMTRPHDSAHTADASRNKPAEASSATAARNADNETDRRRRHNEKVSGRRYRGA
jgi:hypothetical protein